MKYKTKSDIIQTRNHLSKVEEFRHHRALRRDITDLHIYPGASPKVEVPGFSDSDDDFVVRTSTSVEPMYNDNVSTWSFKAGIEHLETSQKRIIRNEFANTKRWITQVADKVDGAFDRLALEQPHIYTYLTQELGYKISKKLFTPSDLIMMDYNIDWDKTESKDYRYWSLKRFLDLCIKWELNVQVKLYA